MIELKCSIALAGPKFVEQILTGTSHGNRFKNRLQNLDEFWSHQDINQVLTVGMYLVL
jgi:hypothetical protein